MSYATPTYLWRSALSRTNLFQDGAFEAGPWTEPVRAGAGLGTLVLAPESVPLDTYAVRVEVTRSGECNVAGLLNLAGLPSMRISLDSGTTWGNAQQPDNAGRIAYQPAGFTLQLTNGEQSAEVTFGAGDAALLVRAKHYGLTFAVSAGPALKTTYDAETGRITLTIGGATTARAAVVYLANSGLPLVATYGGTGLDVVGAAAAQPLPYASFVTGDVWTFSTTESPDIRVALDGAYGLLNGYFRGTLSLPLSDPGNEILDWECDVARWALIKRKGLHARTEYQVWEPKDTMHMLRDVQAGHYIPTVTESDPVRSFPLLVPALDPLGTGSFLI